MQLPESFKRTDSSGETVLQPTGNCRLQKCFISTQSFVYMEIIRLIPVKVQVKDSSDVNWIGQAKNMEVTCSCVNWWLCTSLSVLSFQRTLAAREKHTELLNVKRCVCVCVHIYIDMIFQENTVQAANIFFTPNSGYFKRNCEFNAVLLENGLDRV